MKPDCSFHVFLFLNRQVTKMFVCSRSIAREFAWRCWVFLGFLWLAGHGGPNITLYLSERAPPHIPGFGISNSPAGPIKMARNSLWPLEVQNTAPGAGPPCSIWLWHLQRTVPSLTASLRWPWDNMRWRFISPRGVLITDSETKAQNPQNANTIWAKA